MGICGDQGIAPDSARQSAETPCYLEAYSGEKYLKRFEVVRGSDAHASVQWELTGSRAEALVFCSAAGANLISVLFERYVRSSAVGSARFFFVQPVDLAFSGGV